MFRFFPCLLILVSLTFQFAKADKLSCQWFYSDETARIEMIGRMTETAYGKKVQKAIKTRRGEVVAFDFIPGSLDKAPIVVSGGLWYRISYFNMFNKVFTQQSLIKNAFNGAEQMLSSSIGDLVSSGHPIIITARSSQPESIMVALKNLADPSSINSEPATLDDHANDIVDVVHHLRSQKLIGANIKVDLVSLSYGVGPIIHTSPLLGKEIGHKHIIAPLAFSGDNFPKETAMQAGMINAIKASYSLALMNPFTAGWAKAAMNAQVDMVYKSASTKYSSDLVDGALKNDPEVAKWEIDYPGISEIIKRGMNNDMDAARPDRFRLDDSDFIEQFRNTTIYFAGDEEPSRLKSQIEAFLVIKAKLGKNAPNLVIMDDAQHAITATAPYQTAHIMTTIMENPEAQKTDGTVVYMHRMDMKGSVKVLNEKAFNILKAEIDALNIGPGIPSVLEVIFFPEIFKSRVLSASQGIEDLAAGLKGPVPMPSNFKEDPKRPFQKLQYLKLDEESKTKMRAQIESLKTNLVMLAKIQEHGIKLLKEAQGK